jgi:hypothetical protein
MKRIRGHEMFNRVLWILNDFVQIRILPFRYGKYHTIRPSKTEEKINGALWIRNYFSATRTINSKINQTE